jgi:phytoene desaturase
MSLHRKNTHAVVLGAGFAGLSAAATLARDGFSVTLLEKNEQTGGRARIFREQGFVFDMGPSWYWMPDVIENYFAGFGKSVSDYFDLVRLDPSYQVIFGPQDVMQLPADFGQLKNEFEKTESGAGEKLEHFLREAEFKYDSGMKDFVYKPSLSITEFADFKLLSSLFRLDMFKSFSTHVKKYFSDPRLIRILEFPVLFLGAKPDNTPALYSLMNYADMKLGTWYPMGGMHRIVTAMTQLAKEAGVTIQLNEKAERIVVNRHHAERVVTARADYAADVVVAGADYNHVEQDLLEPKERNYSVKYWNKKTMSPSSLIYYVGLNKKLKKVLHHNLFFDADFDRHTDAIYTHPRWPEDPLFYLCCPSVTDPGVAPEGMENLFILIPVTAGLKDTESIREAFFDIVIRRIEAFCGENISNHILYKRSYAGSDFTSDYNSFKGNAYGLANTLGQTAFLRPSIKSRKVDNLFFTGQLTVPGPGVPPSIISGQVVAGYISKHFKHKLYERTL